MSALFFFKKKGQFCLFGSKFKFYSDVNRSIGNDAQIVAEGSRPLQTTAR